MAEIRPPAGSIVWWRPNGEVEWRFGYCVYVRGRRKIRMGLWNGDLYSGPIVNIADIEWIPR